MEQEKHWRTLGGTKQEERQIPDGVNTDEYVQGSLPKSGPDQMTWALNPELW